MNYKLSQVSFFCPAYFEEKNLPILIPKVISLLSKITDQFEIIIIEDGSPDKTGEVADNLSNQYPCIKVIHHHTNLGYGASLRDGFYNAKYEYIMYTDGDIQYDVNEFIPYIHLLSNADIISGYVTKKALTPLRKIQSVVFNLLVKILFFVNIKDINCSMKIYKRKVLDSISIKSTSAFIDAEMLIKAKRLGFSIAQFPVTHYPRNSGEASGAKFSVIISTIKDMIKFRLGLL